MNCSNHSIKKQVSPALLSYWWRCVFGGQSIVRCIRMTRSVRSHPRSKKKRTIKERRRQERAAKCFKGKFNLPGSEGTPRYASPRTILREREKRGIGRWNGTGAESSFRLREGTMPRVTDIPRASEYSSKPIPPWRSHARTPCWTPFKWVGPAQAS